MDRPILFSAPMVRALLDGRKTQTRRLIKPQPPENVTSAGVISRSSEGQTDEWTWLSGDPRDCDTWGFEGEFKTRFVPGDRLWVKETWAHDAPDIETCRCAFQDAIGGGLTYGPYYRATEIAPETLRWRPSIFMPRWTSRLTLTITDVRVQRLQECSEEDAIAEGIYAWQHDELGTLFSVNRAGDTPVRGRNKIASPAGYERAVHAYVRLWEDINGAGSWEANPWICAISFTVERRNIDA